MKNHTLAFLGMFVVVLMALSYTCLSGNVCRGADGAGANHPGCRRYSPAWQQDRRLS